MGLFFQDVLLDVILLVAALTVAVIAYFNHAYKYWSKRGVAFIEPRFPLGSSNTVLPRGFSVGVLGKVYHDEIKRLGGKFGGVYLVSEPNLVVVDPDYVRDIVATDFQHFVDRGFYYNEKKDPMSAHLFALDGVKWKNLRIKLTPTFTSGKMKMMFQTMVDCTGYMKEAMDRYAAQGSDIDIKEVLGCYTTDVIGSCAFGITCNSFKYPDAEFRKMGKRIFEYDLPRSIKAFFMLNVPNLSLKLGIAGNKRDVVEFFTGVVRDTVEARQRDKISRNDFLQILMDLRHKADVNETFGGFTLNEMVAQVFLFFVAGFETSATAMTFALYELALNDKIQSRLRAEVNEVLAKHDGKITYESLTEMKYLGQVLDETLRKYPPVPTINRRCTQDYKLRDTDVTIEKGTSILISAIGIHRDPEHYPDPDKFDPERFSDENKKSRHPFLHLPFGHGPRNCIGLRFGAMQSKTCIATIIKNFKLTVSPKTKPVVLDPYVFLLNTVDKIYLRAEKI